MGALGAIIGAVAGGGEGAAIGAGVGGAAGLAGSAATPRGQIIIPPESVLTFRTAQPAMVKTVSEAEMARLSYAAGPQQPQGPPRVRYYSPYYGPYYGPGIIRTAAVLSSGFRLVMAAERSAAIGFPATDLYLSASPCTQEWCVCRAGDDARTCAKQGGNALCPTEPCEG